MGPSLTSRVILIDDFEDSLKIRGISDMIMLRKHKLGAWRTLRVPDMIGDLEDGVLFDIIDHVNR